MNKKRGFTLVELLAVIVVLGLILVIAVPQVMNVINDSKKGVLASSARLIANSAENIKLSNDTMGVKTELQCSDVSKISEKDYKECIIEFVNGEARVTIIGQGKYEGMVVCKATSEEAEVIEGECSGGSGGSTVETGVTKIESLATESNTEGLITDDFGNIRYAGASPKNYINFNGEDWRIIGLFEVTTASGTTEKLMRIVKDTQFSTNMSWDSSASGVNYGTGVNEWSQADLMTMLNTYYIGISTTCSYCSGDRQSTCSNDCSSSVSPIGSTYREMIEEVVWNTGAITYADSIERSSAYEQERGITGKICSSGTFCNDTVERETTWRGKVGLMYPSDYGYASANCTNIRSTSCGTNNWLKSGADYWTLSSSAYSSGANDSWLVVSSGFVGANNAWLVIGVRPAIYLKSNVSITSGDGSSSATAYQISMS